jgi:hypothetical protein
MVSHYQLLYISLTLVYEEVICHSVSKLITCRVSPTSSYTNVKLIYIITDKDLPSVILPLYKQLAECHQPLHTLTLNLYKMVSHYQLLYI